MDNALKKGLYRHYKGQYYEVIELARHSETLEWLVFYRTLYGDYSYWVRPLSMFQENVTIDDKVLPRFEFISQDITAK